jgi:uncharacterized RDD family membrane protein YckC
MFKGRRLWAYILDGVILSLLLGLVAYFFAPRDVVRDMFDTLQKFAQANPNPDQGEVNKLIEPFVKKIQESLSPVFFATWIAYSILSIGLEFLTGGSLGKKLAGLKVVDKNNNYLTPLNAIQRNLFHIYAINIPSYLLGNVGSVITFVLTLVWFFTINPKGQTYSDVWFGAYVIKKNTSPAELDSKVEL